MHTFVLSYRVTTWDLIKKGGRRKRERARETTFLTFTAASNETIMFNVGADWGRSKMYDELSNRLLARHKQFTERTVRERKRGKVIHAMLPKNGGEVK